MNRYIYTIFLAATLFLGCSKSEDNSADQEEESLHILITPMIQSRVTELGFEDGDRISLSLVMQSDNSIYAENVAMDYNGSNFVSNQLWYSASSELSTLVAYYPYIESQVMPSSFTISEDQSTLAGYWSSDLMISTKSGVVPTSSSILMLFAHSLSRVVIDIDNQSEVAVASVAVGGSRPTVIFDALTQSVEVDQNVDPITIKTSLWDDGSYKAIVVPQSTTLIFEVTLTDGRVLSREKEDVTFSQGGEYLAQITIVDDKIEISLSGEILEWDNQGTIPSWNGNDQSEDESGGVEEYENYIIYDGVTYNTATYDGFTVMVDNLRYIPQGKVVSSDSSDGNGLWYPYSLSADPNEEGSYIAEALTDQLSIAKYGYLYDFATAFGQEVTADNYDSFESTQGICPEGWYIPTMEDWYALTGDAYQLSNNASAPFYDAIVGYSSIQRANELGFNHQYPGAIANNKYNTMVVESEYTQSSYVDSDEKQESVVGKNSLSYYMSSSIVTYYPNSDLACYYALYTSHASKYLDKGSISVMLTYEHYGISVRCAKRR